MESNQIPITVYRDAGRMHIIGEKENRSGKLGINDYSNYPKILQHVLTKIGFLKKEIINEQVFHLKKKSYESWKKNNSDLVSKPELMKQNAIVIEKNFYNVDQNKKALESLPEFKSKEDLAKFFHHLEIVAKYDPNYFDSGKKENLNSFLFKNKNEESRPLFQKKLFDPNVLRGKIALQKLLIPELQQLLENRDLVRDKEEEFQKINQKIQRLKYELGLRLGAKPEKIGEGVNETAFLKDPFEMTKRQVVAIFKASPERSCRLSGIMQRLKKRIRMRFGQDRLLNRRGNNEQFAEVAAYEFSQRLKTAGLGMDLIPNAKMEKIETVKKTLFGANIYYLEGFQPLSEIKTPRFLDDNIKEKFQILTCVLWAMGQLDPHSNNIFVKVENGQIVDCRGIDLGNSLTQAKPGKRLGKYAPMAKLAMYRKLPATNENLSKDARDKLIAAFTNIDIETWANDMKNAQSQDIQSLEGSAEKSDMMSLTKISKVPRVLVNRRVKDLLNERIFVLKEGLETGIIKQPSDLADIRTDTEFAAIKERIKIAQKK